MTDRASFAGLAIDEIAERWWAIIHEAIADVEAMGFCRGCATKAMLGGMCYIKDVPECTCGLHIKQHGPRYDSVGLYD